MNSQVATTLRTKTSLSAAAHKVARECSRLITLLLIVSWGTVHVSAAGPLVDTRTSPHAAAQAIELDDVAWSSGFWKQHTDTCRQRSIPRMKSLMEGTEYKPFLENFRIAAGFAEGDYHGAQWNDGDFYKLLEAACASIAYHNDPALRQFIDESIRVIGKAQRADGYIHTPVLIRQRNGDATAQPFKNRNHFEMYNMGHLLTAACVHHRVTGSNEFLEIARKTADYLCEAFRDPSPELARNSVCPSHYMGLIELYRVTHDDRYLNVVEAMFRMRDLIEDGGDDNQDRLPFTEQREAAGHAVRANYLYAGAADLYLENGDDRVRQSLDAIWNDVTRHKLYITGGCGALYDGASPDGSTQQSQITRVHQSYGRNYQLPNTTAYNETCANIGSVLWNWRMFLMTGEAKYIDLLELTLCNSILSGVSLSGTDYFYVNPLRTTDPLPVPLRWSRRRIPFVTSYCCPPNVVRTIAECGGYAYAVDERGIWVNLYGANQLSTVLPSGAKVQLKQETEYPWDGTVTVEIEQWDGDDSELRLRIPAWAESAQVTVNDTELAVSSAPGGYCTIRRAWHAGDIVRLELPMQTHVMESHPLVEETRNHAAVQRGPIVYCLEQADLPAGVALSDVSLDVDRPIAGKYDDETLGGVVVLEAGARHRPTQPWNSLYRLRSVNRGEELRVRLIPYYAWANRQPGEMSVWLPIAP